MLITREQFEKKEKEVLAPYAVKSAESRGREYPEKEDPYRSCFQRDRDRIIHSKAFRRLKGKTQVFVAHYGDHYRSRLAHSMEVAQLSRDIARRLGLNEDLAESIALAHDLGHTPFGHAGQDEMHDIMTEFGERFEHNEQSRRVVDFLEEKSPHHPGLNLSFEIRDGLLKHRTPYDQPVCTDTLMPSIEAQIVNIADEIAYLNHDIDDGLRSEIITVSQLDKIAVWQQAKKEIKEDLPFELWVMAMISRLITLMVNDLTENTHQLLAERQVLSVQWAYDHPESLAEFSLRMRQMSTALKAFLHKNFYQSPGVADYNQKGKKVIRSLFNYFMTHPQELPEKIVNRIKTEKNHLVVKDYIAGMTDNFALELNQKIAH